MQMRYFLSIVLLFVFNNLFGQISCSNWLKTQAVGQSVTVGDLDISGNQVTVEANFNCSSFPINRPDKWEDIVSKHSNTTDANYVLRMDLAAITTTNGHYLTPAPCDNLLLNKTYHVAFVYDGNNLKLYRNGFLISQIPATGNLILNNLFTTIGDYAINLPVGTNFLGYINEVRIWNVARTQVELQTYMNTSLPNPTTQVGLKGYYTFDNLLNKQGNAAFNGTLNGGAVINATNPNCTFVADSCFVAACATKEDFSISFDPCSPYSVSLLTTAAVGSYTNIKWDMGNSTVLNGMANPTYNYNSAGNYSIKMILEKPNCNDTVIKVVTLNVTNENIISTNDTTICLGTSKILIGLPFDKFCWSPTTYLTNINSNTPTATPLVTTKYYYTAEKEGNNLVVNGNFSNGNTGFISDYSFATPNTTEGQYFVGTNPILWNGNSGPCVDHTTGNGNMMMVNGSPTLNAKIWSETINVLPNTNYKFSLWIQSISPFNPALLSFDINGLQMGADFSATSINCDWRKHTINWNSGNITTATISIRNKNTIAFGNDFTLDDISFAPISIIKDSVTVTVNNCTTLTCNNWLSTPTQGSYVTVGDLDITGNQITVEANFNSIALSSNGSWGHLISKHTGTTDMNYALSPNGCEIATTTSGYKFANQTCSFPLNKTFHVALVYDGAALKFYRNGFLINQTPCSGNLVTNNLLTTIAQIAGTSLPGEQVTGYTNEVRIWNVARTQAELRTYMNTSLPNPTTQVGLKGYYTFDNLLNKQGNTTFNGTLNGGAVINATNPNCSFVVDSCNVIVIPTQNISNIINEYTPVLALNPCSNKITVENATNYNVGDTVLLIQMKGAIVDSTNTTAFGTITDYKNAGNYEYNYVKSKTGNIIELKNILLRQYDIPTGKVQLIRVPYYDNATVTSTLTCLPWDGSKGGVLVFNVANALTLNNNIDVSGKGFKGGIDPVTNPPVFNCGENQFYYPQNPDLASGKGEGIADISDAKSFGKGALANGGGGGNSHNSAGGGGGNGAVGGLGGYQFEGSPCTGQAIDSRGIGGKLLTYNNLANKVFLGGGGGAGHSNNFENFQALGGNGSGIILISANSLQSNNNKILANGAVGVPCGNSGSGCHEGMGGGGGGGSTLLNITTYLDNISCETKGGKGADMQSAGNLRVGPGGGGGAGILWLKQNAIPASVTSVNTGGLNGVCTAYANDTWGSTPGQAGQTLFNLNLPITTIPFKANIDSVRINVANTTCFTFNFNGLGFTNTSAIATWQWNFGDNTTGVGQNVSHTYLTSNTFIVQLVVTDINGCKDSITRNVTTLCPTEIIINEYTPVLSLEPCKNILTVSNASAYNVGDTVLLIQMKGAIIDSTNTAAFGTITDYKSAGNYEYNYVKSKTGSQIELKNKILRTYEIPNGKVQLIRVPYYQNYSTSSTLTCLPWDGTIGGVLVFNVANTLTLNNNIDVSGKGFKGGNSLNQFNTSLTCFINDFIYSAGSINAAAKGESIYNIGNTKSHGKGSNANGGGGGVGHNSGGGGGSNGGLGGFGGYQLIDCGSAPFDNRGIGGKILAYSNAANKIFLGGGGGSGHTDNAGGIDMKGGNGGGIVIIGANNLDAANFKILSKGDSGQVCNNATNNCHDGNGGGGAGGTVLLSINNYTSNAKTEAIGGKGADLVIFNGSGANQVGPGGGGGAGVTWLKSPTLPTNLISTLTGGLNGVIVQNANNPWGATSGEAGQTLFNLNLPITTAPFKQNIDSVRINALSTSCQAFNFNGLGYTNTSPIASWQWNFGDNTTGNGQNISHTYATTNTFTVTLVVTDINGCKDSITRNVITNTLTVDAGLDKTFCGTQTAFQLGGTTAAAGPLAYAWTSIPATSISNTAIINPTANINSTTTFYFTVTNAQGCTGIDSIKVIINPIPIVQTLNDVAICKGTFLQLTTTAGLNTYQWSNGIYVSDSTIANPIFSDTVPRTLIVTGSNGLCSAKDTINISIKPLPFVKTIKDTLICSTQMINLTTTGAATYSWTPPTFLSSTNSSNPTYIGTGTSNTSTTYYVTGTAANGCIAKDTVIVNMNVPNSFIDPPNKSFCKNESVQLDGFNGNNVFYTWQPPTNITNQTIINPIVNPTITTPYTVNIIDPVCSYSKLFTVIVTVNPLPTITLSKSSDITCSNLSAKLNADGAVTYTWNTSPTLSNINIPNPIANPTTNTTYTVTGIDVNGCKNNNKISVFVSLGKNVFDLPNTFTPNADTKNDCFGAINWGLAQEVYFIIYNRWGEKIFETTNINTCWNGEYKGKPAIEGNYVYYIKAKTACGDVVKKGNVLLIR
jgi:gliding motility-associated-like protein